MHGGGGNGSRMSAISLSHHRCHTPRRRGIQYAAAFPYFTTAAEYWITRFRG
jgi:hypothetical protein